MQICTRMATAVRCKPAALARCPRIVATKPLVDEARDKGRSALVRDGALPGKPHRAQARSYAAERSGLAAHGAVADGTARPAPGINTNERRSALVRDGRYRESLIARERAPTLLQAQPSCATNSASCTALSAAPLRILSETIHRFRPHGCERSSRMRPTNTASWPEACVTGVG